MSAVSASVLRSGVSLAELPHVLGRVAEVLGVPVGVVRLLVRLELEVRGGVGGVHALLSGHVVADLDRWFLVVAAHHVRYPLLTGPSPDPVETRPGPGPVETGPVETGPRPAGSVPAGRLVAGSRARATTAHARDAVGSLTTNR